jgi:3,4-dihydroxy 2-butanone 4-phosphate synthase/GTP cyclohydrolase II
MNTIPTGTSREPRDSDAAIERVLADIRRGEVVRVYNPLTRRGVLFAAASLADHYLLERLRPPGGAVEVLISRAQAERLRLPAFPLDDASSVGTLRTASVSLRSTGRDSSPDAVVAALRSVAGGESVAEDFVQPGYLFPLIATCDGVLACFASEAAATFDLLDWAGLPPAAVMAEDISLHHLPKPFVREVDLRDVISKRMAADTSWQTSGWTELPTADGKLQVSCIVSPHLRGELLILTASGSPFDAAARIHIHAECVIGDVFGSAACQCRDDLQQALAEISATGSGMVVYAKETFSDRSILVASAVHHRTRDLDVLTRSAVLGLVASVMTSEGRDRRCTSTCV